LNVEAQMLMNFHARDVAAARAPIPMQGKAIVTRNADKPNSVRQQVAALMDELEVATLQATEAAQRRR
jgi:hypothetical protein